MDKPPVTPSSHFCLPKGDDATDVYPRIGANITTGHGWSGTLSCYIGIKGGEWAGTYALTCHHCVFEEHSYYEFRPYTYSSGQHWHDRNSCGSIRSAGCKSMNCLGPKPEASCSDGTDDKERIVLRIKIRYEDRENYIVSKEKSDLEIKGFAQVSLAGGDIRKGGRGPRMDWAIARVTLPCDACPDTRSIFNYKQNPTFSHNLVKSPSPSKRCF